jgi:hypothetical protein
MKTLREGSPTPWWVGGIVECACGWQAELEKEDYRLGFVSIDNTRVMVECPHCQLRCPVCRPRITPPPEAGAKPPWWTGAEVRCSCGKKWKLKKGDPNIPVVWYNERRADVDCSGCGSTCWVFNPWKGIT